MSETVRPTKKQREILVYIEGFIAEHGYSPSYREIMNGLNYTSVATVALHIDNLIRRGHLRKRDRSARSLEVVNPTGATGTQNPAAETSAIGPVGSGSSDSADTEASGSAWLVETISGKIGELDAEGLRSVQHTLEVLGLESVLAEIGPRINKLVSSGGDSDVPGRTQERIQEKKAAETV